MDEFTTILQGVCERTPSHKHKAVTALEKLGALSYALRMCYDEPECSPRWVQLSEFYSTEIDKCISVLIAVLRQHPDFRQ